MTIKKKILIGVGVLIAIFIILIIMLIEERHITILLNTKKPLQILIGLLS